MKPKAKSQKPKARSVRPRGGVAESAPTPRFTPTSRLISPDEKRQLILAHAEARQPLDRQARVSMWIGITVSIMFVVGVWAYGLGTEIRRSWASAPDPAIEALKQGGKDLGASLNDAGKKAGGIADDIEAISERLNALKEQDELLNRVAEGLQATSTAATSTREDLFQPTSTESAN
ncbi:hypothetical protein HY479_02950 [Candidatus Uhrbacteria bacterium]|nr:hypothetical protein [Candidatus Uhrbacteria bacterium]